MSRCILVLSLPRSGSSCVAGILARLGVNMGEGELAKANEANPLGYYQDDRWTRLNGDVGGWGYSTKIVKGITEAQKAAYEKLIAECQREPIWGIKHPRLCFVSQFIWPLLDDARMVVIHRPLADVAKSLVRYSEINIGGRESLSLLEANRIIDRWKRAYDQRAAEFPGQMHHVDYYELLEQPERQVAALAEFCLNEPEQAGIGEAIGFVQKKLRHF